MGKRKVLNELSDEDRELITSKSVNSYEKYDKDYKSRLKALDYKINFKPRTENQKKLYNLIEEKEITFVQGAAGTGKSFTAFSQMLRLLKEGNYKQLIILVPTQPIENQGFMPGNLDDKIFLSTLADRYTIEKILDQNGNNGKVVLDNLIKEGLIKFDCISYWRGRNLDNLLLCVSEAANLLPDAIYTSLTRLGTNVKVVYSGDSTQCDLKHPNNKHFIDGLSYAFKKLKAVDEIGFMEFTQADIVRNPILTKIIDAWKKEDED